MATLNAEVTAKPTRQSAGQDGPALVGTGVSPVCRLHDPHGRDARATTLSWSGQILLLQRFSNELEQRLRRRIIRQAEVVVELGVVGFPGSEDLSGNAGVLQHGSETLRLRGCVWMIGDMQDQERRDALALRHVRDGGEVAMFLRIVAELQAVPKSTSGRRR